MKKITKILTLLIFAGSAAAQDTISLQPFEKIIASPHVNVILEKGDKESIRIEYNDIPKNKVNVVVRGSKLKIYLDHARIVEKQVRLHREGYSTKEGIYKDQSITAYVTYKSLKGLEIRGDQELRCNGEINADKFKLKAYGETEIHLASLHTKKFKASVYGENQVTIKSGETDRQVYRLFGENKINSRGLKSVFTTTRIYGEGTISVNATDEVHVSVMGEPRINIEGTSIVSKGIVLGKADIRVDRLH